MVGERQPSFRVGSSRHGVEVRAMNRMAAKQLRSGMVRRRRLYELTARGASVLEQLRGEWRRFSTGVQAVVGGPA